MHDKFTNSVSFSILCRDEMKDENREGGKQQSWTAKGRRGTPNPSFRPTSDLKKKTFINRNAFATNQLLLIATNQSLFKFLLQVKKISRKNKKLDVDSKDFCFRFLSVFYPIVNSCSPALKAVEIWNLAANQIWREKKPLRSHSCSIWGQNCRFSQISPRLTSYDPHLIDVRPLSCLSAGQGVVQWFFWIYSKFVFSGI